MSLEFRAGRSDRSPGRELLAELNALLDSQYPGRSARPGSVTTPEDMAPPGGRFLVGYDDGEAVAIGGVRPLGPDVAEIKRMYVAPGARSRGVGRALLAALDGSCRTPIGGYARLLPDGRLHLTGLVARPDGSFLLKRSVHGPATDSARLGAELGGELRADSPRDIFA